jgi:hypothetical protein
MRTVWLASAAIILSAGAAMAQTSTTSPAPTGAPNAAMAAPNASPGNMAPANGTTTTTPEYSGQNSIKTSTTTSPAPTGAPNAAQMTPPGASPGNAAPNTAPANNMAMSDSAAPKPMKAAMTYHHESMMPKNADTKTYLRMAADAIKHHNKALADDALSHAETRILTRAVPASTGAVQDDSPAITAIEHAREALSSGDYRAAASDTRMAMHMHHGMMNGTGPMGSNP